jgi:hypothetical protein
MVLVSNVTCTINKLLTQSTNKVYITLSRDCDLYNYEDNKASNPSEGFAPPPSIRMDEHYDYQAAGIAALTFLE